MSRVDRISNLPMEVIDEILTWLPIPEAVKTSLLSRNWRYKWASMSSLIFVPVVGGEQQRDKRASFVTRALFLHNDTLSSFILDDFVESGCLDVDGWFVVLSRKMVKNLVLRFNDSQLEQLRFLTVLELSVTFTTDTSDTLVVKNPLLRELVVNCRDVFIHLDVDAPKLKTVSIAGAYTSIKFRNTPEVEFATIVVSSSIQSQEGVLEGLDALERLNLCYIPSLQIFPMGASPKRLKDTYHRLKSVEIHVDFKCSKWVMGLLCLLRSSPILESLQIYAKITFVHLEDELYAHLDDENAWEAAEPTIFQHLKGVRFSGFQGLEQELKLTKFILSNAMFLRSFNIIWDESVVAGDKLTLVMNVTQFHRASSEAKVIFNENGQ